MFFPLLLSEEITLPAASMHGRSKGRHRPTTKVRSGRDPRHPWNGSRRRDERWLVSGGAKPELFQQGAVARRFGIAGGEELVAVKNRIRPSKKTQGQHGLGHLGTPSGEPHGAARHGD